MTLQEVTPHGLA